MEDRLKKFVTIIDTGSYTAAARKLHTSQPGLSVAVKKLERELHAQLLEARGRGFVITEAGKIAYAYGKELQYSAKSLFRDLETVHGRKPILRIGVIDSVAERLFVERDLLESLRKDVDITLHVNRTVTLLQLLQEQECDIVLVVSQNTFPDDFIVEPIGYEEMLFVCAPKIYGDVVDALRQGKLNDFINYNKGSNTCLVVSEYLRNQQIAVQSMLDSTSPELMLHLAVSGKGTAVLPAHIVEKHVETGQLVVLRIADAEVRRLVVAVYAPGMLRNSAQVVIAAAKEILRN